MTGSQQQTGADASVAGSNLWTRRWMWIAWPAFLVAAVLEMVVFAVVDPSDLHWFGQPVTLSREANLVFR